MLQHDEPQKCYVRKRGQTQKTIFCDSVCMKFLKRQICRSRKQICVCLLLGNRNTDLLPFLFSGDGNVLKFEHDNGCTTLSIYQKSTRLLLKLHLKMNEFCTVLIIPQYGYFLKSHQQKKNWRDNNVVHKKFIYIFPMKFVF